MAFRTVGALRGRGTGLLGLPWLRQPTDLIARAEHVKQRCEHLVTEAAALPPSVSVLHVVDRISETLCSTLDVASLVQAVHPDPDWISAAEEVSVAVGNTMAHLNTDSRLYDALQRVRASAGVFSLLSAEQRRFVELLSAEFEADGVHLPRAQQARVHKLQAQVNAHCSAFMSALARARAPARERSPPVASALGRDGARDTTAALWVPSALLGALPEPVRAPLESSAGLTRLPDDAGVYASVLKWCEHEPLRQTVHRRTHALAAGDNLRTLEALLGARRELAGALGFDSHTHMALAHGRMARDEEEVERFLSIIQDAARPKLATELDELGAAKRARGGGGGGALGAWDVPFLTGRLKAARWSLDARALAAYFEIESALSGLSGICQDLFALSLHERPLEAGEGWAAGVRKFALIDTAPGAAAEPAGHVYIDLYARERKQAVNATFTLSAGDRSHRADRPHRAAARGAGEALDVLYGGAPADDDVPLALPTVAIVCSFAGGPAADGRHAPHLLSHAELVTLYHEFGHALHALLARTELQHLSGVRGPLDFVETPALLFERLATDWRVLRRWATHARTGERIPDELVRNLRRSDGQFAGYDTAVQVLYARTDLAFHGPNPPDAAGSTGVVRALHADVFGAQLPWVDGADWHASFTHFVSYGSGYYAYLWSRSLSAQLWDEHFEQDPLSSSAGALLRHGLLAPGNSLEPAEMLADVLDGRELDMAPFLQELGLYRDEDGTTPPPKVRASS
jgi:intermediate peptidase